MARKKKLNRKLLITLSVGVGLVVVLAAAAAIGLFTLRSPSRAFHKAQQQDQAGQWEEAKHSYSQAVAYAIREHDARGEVQYRLARAEFFGRLLDKKVYKSLEEAQQLVAFRWKDLEAVAQLDENHEEAHRLLTDMAWDRAQATGGWQDFVNVATKYLKIKPDDVKAQSRLAQALTELADAESAQSTQRTEKLAAARAAHEQTIRLDPKNPQYRHDLLVFFTQHQMREEAGKHLLTSIQEVPDSALLRVDYTRYLVAGGLKDEAKRQMEDAEKIENHTFIDCMVLGEYMQQAIPELDKQADVEKALAFFRQAQQMEPMREAPYMSIAAISEQKGDRDQARKTLREGLAQVEKIRNGRELNQLSAEESARYRSAMVMLNYHLANMTLGALSSLTAEQKVQEIGEAEAAMVVMDQYGPNMMATVKLKGKWALMVENDSPKAIRLLQGAFDGFAQNARAVDLETATLLARLYDRDEPGAALGIWSLLDRSQPNNPEYVLQMLRLELRGQQLEAAKTHIAQLKALQLSQEQTQKLAARERELAQLQGQAVGPTSLPTTIPASEVRTYITEASRMLNNGQRAEAIDLLEALVAQQPDNEKTWFALAQAHLMLNQEDKAKDALARARQRPALQDSQDLKLVETLLNAPVDQRREKLAAWQLENIQKIEDPIEREYQLALFEQARGNAEGIQTHLAAAQQALMANPSADPKVASIAGNLFAIFLTNGLFEEAEKLVPLAAQYDWDHAQGKILQVDLHAARARKLAAQQPVEARREWDTVIQMMGEILQDRRIFSKGYAVLGDAYLATNDLTKARESYLAAYQQNSTNAAAIIGLARLAERANDQANYQQFIREAARFAPTDPYVQPRYVKMLIDEGKLTEAIAQLEQRTTLTGQTDLGSALVLADLYERVRPPQMEKAERMYEMIYTNYRGKKGSMETLSKLVDFLLRANKQGRADELVGEALKSPAEPDKVGAYVLYGQFLLQTGRPAEAGNAFQEAVTRGDKDVRARQAMARFYASQHKWPEAIEQTEAILALQPDSLEYKRLLISMFIDAEQYDNARTRAAQMLQKTPGSAPLLALAGLAAQRANDPKGAREMYDQAIAADPQSVEALSRRGELSNAEGRTTDAINDIRASYLALPPEELAARRGFALRLAQLCQRAGDPNGAKDVLQDARKRSPLSEELIRALAQVCFDNNDYGTVNELIRELAAAAPGNPISNILEAQKCNRAGDRNGQVAALEKAYNLAASDPEVRRLYVAALVGNLNYEKALQIIDAVSMDPSDPNAAIMLSLRGRTLAGLNQEAEALKQFDQAFRAATGSQPVVIGQDMATALDKERPAGANTRSQATMVQWVQAAPDNWAVWLALGQSYLDQERWMDAKDAFAKVVGDERKIPRNFVAYRQAVISERLNDIPGARAAYEAIVKNDPNGMESLNNLAYLLAERLNEPQAAVPYAVRAMQLAPNNPNVSDTLGWVYFRAGNLANAEAELNRSIKIEETGAAHYHLGMVLEQANRKDEAVKEYRRANELLRDDTKNEFYKLVQERLAALGQG